MPPQHPSSTTTTYLDQPPSCLQFCPASQNNFVVGTYLLSETKSTEEDGTETIQQSKTGSLQLWHLDPATDTLSQKSRHALDAAVFDLQFHPRHPNILAIATSDASVSLFAVSETGFTLLWTKNVHEDPSIPALFLAWLPENWLDPSGSAAAKDGFAVTFSDGRTGVFGVDPTGINATNKVDGDEQVMELGNFEARQPIEIWFVAAASYPSLETLNTERDSDWTYTPYLFTGNDFGSLHTRRFPDTRKPQAQTQTGEKEDQDEENDTEDTPLPSLLLNADDKARHHTAGVTSILPLPIPLSHPLTNGEPLLLTGSYDENLRVYHATRGGVVLAEAGLGGGVWRLQLLSSTRTETAKSAPQRGEKWTFLVLASCMHGGTRVVRVVVGGEEAAAGIEVLVEFTEHESMNYASDVWRPHDQATGELRVVSSSFYDRRVCIWKVRM
ncbi:uncharacterized protein APUU_30511A [Aspergillus puulaauensis]|uniref:WD40 repeat-like protein n=1 Tax=Aspergillus puulaauensis TaxID=1220207 RepID=A0A7R8AKI7_9EURO|nr:uncharacterized protein APUU_30511A [Aspergillus puulaauensis]BCS22286.1 hypothetical protein APUU_30511A [Aspergillus puulaauensis]